MSTKTKPLPQQIMVFVKHHLGDKYAFAPFTGQDWSGWNAWVYLLEMYGRSDINGRSHAMRAMNEVIQGVQNTPAVHQLFIQAIPGVLDWSFTAEIWPDIESWHGVIAFEDGVAWTPYHAQTDRP